jgi:hypothetical protein
MRNHNQQGSRHELAEGQTTFWRDEGEDLVDA